MCINTRMCEHVYATYTNTYIYTYIYIYVDIYCGCLQIKTYTHTHIGFSFAFSHESRHARHHCHEACVRGRRTRQRSSPSLSVIEQHLQQFRTQSTTGQRLLTPPPYLPNLQEKYVGRVGVPITPLSPVGTASHPGYTHPI